VIAQLNLKVKEDAEICLDSFGNEVFGESKIEVFRIPVTNVLEIALN